MAYDTDKLYEEIKKAIKSESLYFVNEIPPAVGISKDTFYNHFPAESDRHKELMLLLLQNKSKVKAELRRRWRLDDNATLQLALYRLSATPEERRLLSTTYIDHTSGDKPIAPVNWSELDEDTIAKIYNAIGGPKQD